MPGRTSQMCCEASALAATPSSSPLTRCHSAAGRKHRNCTTACGYPAEGSNSLVGLALNSVTRAGRPSLTYPDKPGVASEE